VEPLLTGAPSVRVELAPGGHLGVLTGRGARRSTWRVLDDFLGQNDVPPAAVEEANRRAEQRKRRPVAA
jgi:polyhydroxyalkanoate synthase